MRLSDYDLRQTYPMVRTRRERTAFWLGMLFALLGLAAIGWGILILAGVVG